MNIVRLKNILGVSVLTIALLFQIALTGFVICIGDDGHIAIELEHFNDHCSEHDTPCSTEDSLNLPAFHADHSENCVDIPLQNFTLKQSTIQKRMDLKSPILLYTRAIDNSNISHQSIILCQYSLHSTISYSQTKENNLHLLI